MIETFKILLLFPQKSQKNPLVLKIIKKKSLDLLTLIMKFTLRGKSYLFCLGLLFVLSSCSKRYKDALFTAKSDAVMDTLKSVYIFNNNGPEELYYKIKSGDRLAIRNLQNIEFGAQQGSPGSTSSAASSAFIVEVDGSVNLPVVGKVPVVGLTRTEATSKLQGLYSKTLKDPIVELSIVNLKVTFLGEFKSPGNYLIEKDNTSLIEIMGQAGGLSERADGKSLKIIRGNKTHPEIIYVNLKNVNSLASPKLMLQNDDIVYVEPKKIFSSSEKMQTTMTFIQPILLILNTAVIIYNLSR